MEDRITARVPAHIKDKLIEAADIEGATLNQFLVQAALERALATIERERVLKLSYDDAQAFFEAVENPPEPNHRVSDAVARYQLVNRTSKDTA